MKALWGCVRENLSGKLSENNLRLWINPLTPLRIEAQTIWLGCPNKFFLSWVRDKYLGQIEDTLKEIPSSEGSIVSVKLEIAPVEHALRPAPPTPAPHQFELPRIQVHKRKHLRFNRNFTFDRFVVGSGNDFAYSASRALAQDHDLHTESLYLLSPPGLGKSHLCQAIGQEILSKDLHRKVLYLTAEDFTNEMVYSIKNNCLEGFKDKYRRQCDVLVLEEVNFLSGKEKVQSEFTYTLDCLMEEQKKVVLTSRYLPKDIPRLRRTLASRLNNGLISSIKPPDYETRLRILETKAKAQGLKIRDDVLAYLAQHLTQDVRQLECCLYSLGAKSKLLSRRIDQELAEEVVEELVADTEILSPDAIFKAICKMYQVDVSTLSSRSRKKSIVLPRNVAMYLFREFTDLSLEAIGKQFDRNHSTVLYGINIIERAYEKDLKLKGQIDLLKKQLGK
ncbi:MAG: chromosomal replication initiator protein DnaA [Deltaproteobacteria bacterium]|nr:chromosomal replication initiator protein DnaA [Deltaproteobacteria bacterium]